MNFKLCLANLKIYVGVAKTVVVSVGYNYENHLLSAESHQNESLDSSICSCCYGNSHVLSIVW